MNNNENSKGNTGSNKSTEKIKRNFLALSPEKKAESLALLLELSETAPSQEERRHFLAVHNSLKNLDDSILDAGTLAEKEERENA